MEQLTKVPLPPSQHLQEGEDECADQDTGTTFRDIEHPYKSDDGV